MHSYLKNILQNQAKFKETNKDFMMCCPYHSETTPSFGVNKENGAYNCFGCGAKGGVLELTEKILNLSKAEAVKRLVAEGIFKEQSQVNNLALEELECRFLLDTSKENWLRLSLRALRTQGVVGNEAEDYEPFNNHFYNYLKKKRGFKVNTLYRHQSLYLVKKDVAVKILHEGSESVVKWGKGNLLVVYRNEAGEPITLKHHDTNTEIKDKKFYLPLAKMQNSFFNSIMYEDQALCFLVEGEMDALALNSCGFNAIAVGSLQRLASTLSSFTQTPQRFYIGLPDFKLGDSLVPFKKYNREVNQFCFILDDLRELPQHKILTEAFEDYKDICEFLLNKGASRLIQVLASIVSMQIGKTGNFYEGKNLFGCYTIHEKTRFVCRKNRSIIIEEVQIDNKERYKEQLGNFLFGFKAELKPLFFAVSEYCNKHFTRPVLRKKNRPDVLSDQLFMESGNLYINSYVAGGYHKQRNILSYDKKEFEGLNAENYVKVFKQNMPNLTYYLDKVLNTKVNGDDAIAFYINFLALKWHKPNYKSPRIIILQGDYGSGKGTFVDILMMIFGEESVASVRDIEKKFNKMLANRLFWFIDEQEDRRKVAEAYATLKNNTGNIKLEIEGKNENAYNLENYATPILTSNEVDPILKIQPNDRRILYFNSNWIRTLLQTKKQHEVDKEVADYFKDFRDNKLPHEIEILVKYLGCFKDLINESFIKTYKSVETLEVAGMKDDLYVFLENLIMQPEITVNHYNATRQQNEPMHPPVVSGDFGVPDSTSPFCIIKRSEGSIEINNESLTLLVGKQIGKKINKQRGVRSIVSKYNAISGIDKPERKKKHHFGFVYWYNISVKPTYTSEELLPEFSFEVKEDRVIF